MPRVVHTQKLFSIMNDLYLSLANSTLGKNVFEALNLPKPPELMRSGDDTLSHPRGAILFAAVKGSQYYRGIAQHLNADSIKLFTPVFDDHLAASQFTNLQGNKVFAKAQSVNFSTRSQRQFRALVLDASGCQTPVDLDALYAFFHKLISKVKNNGRIVIITNDSRDKKHVLASSIAAGINGFAKSIAKETGKRGICCNQIEVVRASERQLRAPLHFLLSPKSAYITGQSLRLDANGSGPRKFDWQSPLADKTLLVTGAAQGIGKETALVLARDGARVILLDIPANGSKLRKLAEQISGHAIELDLIEDTAPEQLLEIIASQLGGIDGVIHNAGITRDKTLARMPQHFWQQVLKINLQRVIEINQLLLDRSALNPHARLVCISSISGIAGNFGQSNYALSKAAVAGYCERLAPHLTQGITINAIAPGFIETDMTQKIPLLMREVGRRSNSFSQGGLPLDVAESVALFCHPAASALNGNLLRVCGQSLLGR